MKHDDVLELISAIHLGIRRYLQIGLETQDLTLNQNRLMMLLSQRPFLNPSEAAELLSCDRPTASVIIRNLEKKGWLSRQPDPENRRRVRIVLTDAGRAKTRQTLAWGRKFKGEFDPTEMFADSEADPLKQGLEKINAYIVNRLRELAEE
ncbi:MarR family transcriptional regulator [Candidatus Bipolaricaulota bacterium]|nr:MarR family transcriptional regulator [Candidatus Bipolaricaulota bacterium]TFH10764.1 MAG: MarR family transcriptional regulator [Candidatus Atribacteria bacterium]